MESSSELSSVIYVTDRSDVTDQSLTYLILPDDMTSQRQLTAPPNGRDWLIVNGPSSNVTETVPAAPKIATPSALAPATVVEILVEAEDLDHETDPPHSTVRNGNSSELIDQPSDDNKAVEPIEITDNSLVLVNGKSCILRTNPDTGAVLAYPSGRTRGRPKGSKSKSTLVSSEAKTGGRARKTPQKYNEYDLDDDTDASSSSHSQVLDPQARAAEGAAPPVKRPRGRPPVPKPPLRPIALPRQSTSVQLKCPLCGAQSHYERQYLDHLHSAHPDQIKTCKCCHFACIEDSDLVKHYTQSHPKNFCTYCGLTSDKAYVIRRHVMRHTQEGCQCKICGKTMKDIYILKSHIKLLHSPVETVYECSICQKKFNRRPHLNRHMRIHQGDRSFKCPHCSYCGLERADVTKHMTIHDEPKFPCQICSKLFRQAKNRDLHMKRHNQQRDYKCGLCDFLGYTFTDIRKHIDRAHKDNSLIYCEKCESVFKSTNEYAEHIKSGPCQLTETSVESDGIVFLPLESRLETVVGDSVIETHDHALDTEDHALDTDNHTLDTEHIDTMLVVEDGVTHDHMTSTDDLYMEDRTTTELTEHDETTWPHDHVLEDAIRYVDAHNIQIVSVNDDRI